MQSLGLIMHELATNATKHGALSTPAGSVAIDWTRDPADHGVTMVWREQGGPPVAEPTRKGFGQVMFERIGASLDGSISTDFRPEGFVCTVTVAANNLIAEARLGAVQRLGRTQDCTEQKKCSSQINMLIGPVGLPQQLPSDLALTNFPSPTQRKISYGRAGWKVRENFMRRLATSTWLVCVSLAALQLSAAAASDLVWEVENPFRFFKKSSAFALHEKAYDAVRGKPDTPVPANIVWRTERRLNDPDCADKSSPGRCYDTKRAGYERSRLGWAAQTLESVCYERNSRPFRYMGVCERQYSWGTAKEDYILPEAHTVAVTLSAERLAEAGAGECTFSWLPRAGAGKGETDQAAVQEAIRHQAGAVLAGQQGFRRDRQGHAAGRA